MASNKAPKHDFAPAWLKIPQAENPKSSGPKQAEHDRNRGGRRDDFYGDRRYPGKSRHHSLDDDFYGNSYYNPYFNNGYNGGFDRGGHPFRSQPGIYRDGGPKYPPHSGPRYPPGAMNGYPPPHGNGYFDGPGYGGYNDFYQGDMFYNHHVPPPRPQSAAGHRRLYDGRGRGGASERDKENKHSASNGPANGGDKKKDDSSLEEDFPSLVGENEPPAETKPQKTLSNSGVWEKGPISKIKSPSNNKAPLNSKGVTSPRQNGIDNPRDSVKHNTSNIYKALIPNKANLIKKGSKDSFYGGRDINSNTSSFAKPGRERAMSPTSASMDVLNTRTVTQPKKLSDRKSDFLKQLKKENGQANGDLSDKAAKGEDEDEEEKEEHLVNGVSDLTVAATAHHSLISIEAEERLLKEMGWTEDGEEEYVITEDDMQKFNKSIQQLKQQRNGFKRTLPKVWSPQHHVGVPVFQTPPPQEDTNDSVSSSDDSDLDC